MIGTKISLNHFLIGDIMENIIYITWKKDKNLYNFWQMDYLGGLYTVYIPDSKYYIVKKLLMFGTIQILNCI